jgi:hypothetical protein
MLIGIVLIGSGCEEEKIETTPQKAILGKWEIIEIGNWPNLYSTKASGYTEFREDLTMIYFDYELNKVTTSISYAINDSILFQKSMREDGIEILFKYKYELINNKKHLRLDNTDFMAINNTSIYNRIN